MKKLIVVLFVFFLLTIEAKAMNDVTIYFFNGDGCPHCAEEEIFLDELMEEYPNVEVKSYEVWYSEGNRDLMVYASNAFNDLYDEDVEFTGVPTTIIGDEFVIGFSENVAPRIEEMVKEATTGEYNDVMAQIIIDFEADGGVIKQEDAVNPIFFMIGIPVVIVGILILIRRLMNK
jgi:thiol-disulfide isomerase/thioredoxin